MGTRGRSLIQRLLEIVKGQSLLDWFELLLDCKVFISLSILVHFPFNMAKSFCSTFFVPR
ncbi:hypothetical protein GLYMA_14G113701v4 [Glycine max]|nr:hypothetical protein GLYMA_14G113701v4 [Glycine max]